MSSTGDGSRVLGMGNDSYFGLQHQPEFSSLSGWSDGGHKRVCWRHISRHVDPHRVHMMPMEVWGGYRARGGGHGALSEVDMPSITF